MRKVKMSILIGESFDRMVEMLFRPFSAKKWFRLTLIALLAGMLFGANGSGGGGGNSSNAPKETKAVSVDHAKTQAQAGEASSTTEKPAQSPEDARRALTIAIAVISVFAILGLAFIIFMTWIGARFKFVWFNAVVNNTTAIKEPFSAYKKEGNSFFRLSILLFLIFVLMIILVAAFIIYAMIYHGAFQQGFKWTPVAALKIFLAPGIAGIISLIAFFIFTFYVDHLLVPIMAMNRCAVLTGLGKLGSILGRNWKDVALFTLIFFVLSLVGGTLAGFAALIVFLVLVLAGALIFGLPYLILGMLLKLKYAFIAYSIAVGVPFLCLAVMTLLAVSLPLAVFFRAFSIKYLLSLDQSVI